MGFLITGQGLATGSVTVTQPACRSGSPPGTLNPAAMADVWTSCLATLDVSFVPMSLGAFVSPKQNPIFCIQLSSLAVC